MEEMENASPVNSQIHEVVSLLRDLLHTLMQSSIQGWINLPLTLPQLRTLFVIAHHRTLSVAQVSQHLGIGEPTASHLVERLVQADLIRREEDPQDRRRVQVRLSPAGEELIERLLGWEQFLGEWLQHISPEKLSLLQQGLSVIMAELPSQEMGERPVQQEELTNGATR